MNNNDIKPSAIINAFHLDNIGKLYVLIEFYNLKNIADKFKQDKIKIFNKCEDGNLDIKIKLNAINLQESNIKGDNPLSNSLNIKIFLSKSLSPKLNATKFILNSNCINDASGTNFERLTIVYCVNANIFNKNNLFEKSSESFRVTDCFAKINPSNSNTEEPFYLKSIKKIDCKNCEKNLYDFCEYNNEKLNNVKIKIIENFDYDYVDKLENLSCHESHTEDIIPNIEEKLKMRININDHYIQINKYLRELSKNSNLIVIKKNNNDYAFCMNCHILIGFIDKLNDKKYEFLNIILNAVEIEDEEDIVCRIDVKTYFKYRIMKSLSENLNRIYLINSDEIRLKGDLKSVSYENKTKNYLEVTKNVVNISTTVSFNLFDTEKNEISFDNSNIKRSLLIYLINSNSNENSYKKDNCLIGSNDYLDIIEEKNVLFVHKSEREEIFDSYRMPNSEINKILRENPMNSKIGEYFICEI